MERNFFIYKTYCELAIVSNDICPDNISEELNIVPERHFKKGEQSISKHSGSIITRPHNLWALKSKTSKLGEETISHHIEYFKSTFSSKIEVLKKYKDDIRFEITFWIWVETDNAGIGLDLNQNEIAFLSSISNRIHFSLITKAEDSHQ
jgi:Domain of unknown function (DUF4279)